MEDLSVYDAISMGFIWLHQDAEIFLDASIENPLSTLILSYEYDIAKQAVRYVGEGEEPTRLFELAVGDKVIWDDSKDNKRFEAGFIILKEDLEGMGSNIRFAVKLGDNIEIIDVIKKD